MLSRRGLLLGAGALVTSGLAAGQRGQWLAARASEAGAEVVETRLVAAERRQALPCFGGRALPLWTFSAERALPVLRLRKGALLRAELVNQLPRPGEHASIHWHGIRLPNAQDGVPFLTQEPVPPGKRFTYEFAPPDTGTFFFHTHCNTTEQLGRGLAGVLIVDGDQTEPYDEEHMVALRDWSITPVGAFGPFLTDEASRAGTFGTIRSANGHLEPAYPTAASADIRLRLINMDRTRIMQLGMEGADCAVIAIDGNAVAPFPLKAWFAGPATRLDLVFRSPPEGAAARLVDYFAAKPVTLARFDAQGPALRSASFDPAPLKPSAIPEPDLGRAERQVYSFSASARGGPVAAPIEVPPGTPDLLLDELCTTPRTFWAINKQAWPGRDHRRLPLPVATLAKGRSYIFELRNLTPHMHPIHIHGHTFKWLKSNKRDLPVHHADTVLLQPRERVEVAFVADNPGDWMFHCHIIEHQETGMMSYVRVA
jgi:FtsP/CotA-like multicopper oxidase with cupredoxin domain